MRVMINSNAFVFIKTPSELMLQIVFRASYLIAGNYLQA